MWSERAWCPKNLPSLLHRCAWRRGGSPDRRPWCLMEGVPFTNPAALPVDSSLHRHVPPGPARFARVADHRTRPHLWPEPHQAAGQPDGRRVPGHPGWAVAGPAASRGLRVAATGEGHGPLGNDQPGHQSSAGRRVNRHRPRLTAMVRRWFGRGARDRALDAELEWSLQHDIGARIASGMTPGETRGTARTYRDVQPVSRLWSRAQPAGSVSC
jgi:hypothetical protein